MKNFTLQKCGEKHMETGEKRRKTEAFGQMVKIKSQGTIINKCARFRQQQHCECNCNCGRNKLFFTLLAQKQWPTASDQFHFHFLFGFAAKKRKADGKSQSHADALAANSLVLQPAQPMHSAPEKKRIDITS